MKQEDKFVFTISCNPEFSSLEKDTVNFIDRITILRIKQIDSGIINQLREIGKERGINTLIAIDETKVIKMAKKAEALEIIKNKPFNTIWFTYYKDYEEYCLDAEYADESKRLTEEEWNFLKEALYE